MRSIRFLAAALAAAALSGPAAAQPAYNIIDIGVRTGGSGSQGFSVSPDGSRATGQTLFSTSSVTFQWFPQSGRIDNSSEPTRPFEVANGINNAGFAVGTGFTTDSGSNPLPLEWFTGFYGQLPLPAGETSGRAQAINAANVAVGSVNSGSAERGVIYSLSPRQATIITQTTANGSFVRTAVGINNSGRIVGQGIDPNAAARNVGYVLDTATGTAFDVGALPGFNGALNFGVSNAGHVTGSNMLNQGPGLPFVYTDATGIRPIPLPAGTTQGSGRAVNSLGMVVGTASSAFAIPFLYDGTATYRLGDLIPAGSGWDLLTNTSSSAMGISEGGVIVGTGVFNGSVHAYVMVPAAVPEPGTFSLVGLAALALRRRLVRRPS